MGLDFAKNNGVNIISNDELAKEFSKYSKGLDEEWIESVKNKGVDANAALKELRKIAQTLSE